MRLRASIPASSGDIPRRMFSTMGVRSGDLDVLFAAAGGTGRAHVLIRVATGADDRRIAAPSREFKGEAAGGGAAGDFALVVESRAVNGPGRRRQHAPHGRHAEFRFDAKPRGVFFETFYAFLPKFSLR